jgi:ankyrin repeat protein
MNFMEEKKTEFYYSIDGPSVPLRRYDDFEFHGLNEQETEFFRLVQSGDADAMWAMMENGVNLHAKTEEGTTALMVAVEYGHYQAAEMLLKAKIDINARECVDAESSGQGVSAVNLAARNKDCQMIELLLQYGGNINERAGFDGEFPFLIAVCSNDYAFMDFVLQKGADVNSELYDGKTALIHAVLTDDKKLAAYLLEKGADIDHRNITDLTALEIAKGSGLSEMAEFLITAGATDSPRRQEHLVTYRQDFYVWDNDIAYAYYHWSTDDGFSHFLIYGVGYLNRALAMSDLHRFYIRKRGNEFVETYAGDDHNWFHYVRTENGEVVDERFNSSGRNLGAWGDLIITPDRVYGSPDARYTFEPAQSKEFDFDGKYQKLSQFFFRFVSIVKEEIESKTPSVKVTYKFSRYSEKGWDFLGPFWQRASINAKKEHIDLITDFLTQYFEY